jgi:hypothetical protein
LREKTTRRLEGKTMNKPIEQLWYEARGPFVRYADHCAVVEEKERLRANAVARCDTLWQEIEKLQSTAEKLVLQRDECIKSMEQSIATSKTLLAERDALKYANDVVQKLQSEIMRTPCAPRGRWDDILPNSL